MVQNYFSQHLHFCHLYPQRIRVPIFLHPHAANVLTAINLAINMGSFMHNSNLYPRNIMNSNLYPINEIHVSYTHIHTNIIIIIYLYTFERPGVIFISNNGIGSNQQSETAKKKVVWIVKKILWQSNSLMSFSGWVPTYASSNRT